MILSDIEYETLQEALNASKDEKTFSHLFGFLSDNIDDLEDEDRKQAINGIWDVFTLSLKVPYEGNPTDYHDSDSGHEYFTSCLDQIDEWNENNEDEKLDTLLKENFEDVFSFIKKYKLFKLASEFSINLRNNSKSQDLITEYKKLTSYVVNESDDEWKAEGGLRRFLDDFDLSKAQADNILKMAENLCSKSDLKDIKTLYQERCEAPEDDYDYLHEDEHWTKFSRVM
jgi:hypothetical protein